MFYWTINKEVKWLEIIFGIVLYKSSPNWIDLEDLPPSKGNDKRLHEVL